MDQQRIDMFIMTNQKYFPEEKMVLIRERLNSITEEKFSLISTAEFKDPTTILLVSIFLGTLGIDRFMIGDTGMGILKLLTAGCCGILTIIDWFTIQKKAKELNFNKFMSLVWLKRTIIKKHFLILAAGTLYFLMCRLLDITCPIKALFGIKCPTCGMTRAIISLLRGNITMYFKYNPFAVPCLFSVLWLIHRKVFRAKKACDILAVSFLLINFIYYIYSLLYV